jgi:N-acetylmuramoyl-L-alanine amidase
MLVIDRSKKFAKFYDIVEAPRKIDFLVLHHVEAKSVEHAIEQFENHQVSSHFLIDESGKIFELVDENNIAYHAGVSFWRGIDGLNKTSIGIEFINSAPFSKKFETVQMQAGVELCKYLIAKYRIRSENVVGHSDIGYVRETGILDRKQDPSHLFDWKLLSNNGVGIFPEISLKNLEDEILFQLGNRDKKISEIKNNLQKFGYRVMNLNDEFDLEMQALVRVFNRRFNAEIFNEKSDAWLTSSDSKLTFLTTKIS